MLLLSTQYSALITFKDETHMEQSYKYLIIGGGMTADAAVKGIRELDTQGSIGILSADVDAPYTRPLLSKGLWKGKPVDKIWRGTQDHHVDLRTGREAAAIDPRRKQVTDAEGNTIAYEKLLLATGGSPRRLPFGGDTIIYFRTFRDYQRLRQLADTRQRFAVIGSGFIGSEIAAALAMNGKEVVMLFPDEGICSRVFPSDLSAYLLDYYREKGVEVMSGEMVEGLESHGEQTVLKTRSGKEIAVDGVVAGIGIVPNTILAEAAELQVDNGIVVDELLRTTDPDIYAAGDVANFYSPALGKRIRVEHEDNAVTMGTAAGRIMAGDNTLYHHLPMFYSDLFDLGYEAVGELDPSRETFVDWLEPYQKGVIHYLDKGRVRGVLLWNVWDQVESARKLIAEPEPYQRVEDLKQWLPA
jgi:NADPH-dependent 2,4-dienoyl-CoA reductase/sulfur reductase-like enzyme